MTALLRSCTVQAQAFWNILHLGLGGLPTVSWGQESTLFDEPSGTQAFALVCTVYFHKIKS